MFYEGQNTHIFLQFLLEWQKWLQAYIDHTVHAKYRIFR